jgi:hypothetical protein
VQDTLTADSVEDFLRQNEIGVLVENGGMCPASPLGRREELNASLTAAILHEDEEPKVLDEVKLIFYAVAELGVRYLLFGARNVH